MKKISFVFLLISLINPVLKPVIIKVTYIEPGIGTMSGIIPFDAISKEENETRVLEIVRETLQSVPANATIRAISQTPLTNLHESKEHKDGEIHIPLSDLGNAELPAFEIIIPPLEQCVFPNQPSSNNHEIS